MTWQFCQVYVLHAEYQNSFSWSSKYGQWDSGVAPIHGMDIGTQRPAQAYGPRAFCFEITTYESSRAHSVCSEGSELCQKGSLLHIRLVKGHPCAAELVKAAAGPFKGQLVGLGQGLESLYDRHPLLHNVLVRHEQGLVDLECAVLLLGKYLEGLVIVP